MKLKLIRTAEGLTKIVQGLIDKNGYKYVIASNTTTGKDFLPRIASKYEAQPINEITNILVKIQKKFNTIFRPKTNFKDQFMLEMLLLQ